MLGGAESKAGQANWATQVAGLHRHCGSADPSTSLDSKRRCCSQPNIPLPTPHSLSSKLYITRSLEYQSSKIPGTWQP